MKENITDREPIRRYEEEEMIYEQLAKETSKMKLEGHLSFDFCKFDLIDTRQVKVSCKILLLMENEWKVDAKWQLSFSVYLNKYTAHNID